MVAPKFSPALAFLRKLVVLPPLETKGFQVFGLRLDHWHRRISGLLTLGDPLAGGSMALRLMELRQDPRAVWVMNEGDRRILLPAGERLPGARARRLRVSLVLGARETLRLRPDLLEVDPEPTGAPDLPPIRSHTPEKELPRHATGVVLVRGGRILCLHLFDCSETLRRLLPGIYRTCSVAPFPADASWSNLNVGEVEAWLEQVSSLRAQVRAALGLGREVFIDEETLRGRCLLLEECPVHAVIIIVEPPPPPCGEGHLDEDDDLPEAIPPISRRRERSGASPPSPAAGPVETPSPGGRSV